MLTFRKKLPSFRVRINCDSFSRKDIFSGVKAFTFFGMAKTDDGFFFSIKEIALKKSRGRPSESLLGETFFLSILQVYLQFAY